MEYAVIVLKQVLAIFLIAFIGIVCYRSKLITKEGGKHLSNLALYVVTPCLLFMSFQIDINSEILAKLGMALILSVLSHIILIAFAYIVIRKKEDREYSIERFALIYTNCGYIGIPLVQGVFGTEGVLYVTVYLTLFNILIWTHGITIIKNEFSKKELLSIVTSPSIIAITLGIIFFVLRIKVPQIIATPLNYVAAMNTPLPMIVAGITIGQTNVLRVLKNARVLLITLLRLIIAPMIVIPILSLISCDKTVFMTVMLAVSCPSAAIGTMFAVKHNKNALYCSELFAITTILSAVTMPLMILYMRLFC